ncbi:MAG: helix-hairpin-helix domain-containing protein [Candidatus Margulisbacteria bacterium]|nr:helix-hairpin-helix domain-containing protein [Candidatus Margulisiibacteriota bacterium]
MKKCLPNPLMEIPGVGKSIAADLNELDIKKVSDLRGRNPEELYKRLCIIHGQHLDRCLLYVFRNAVYYASTPNPDQDKLKWWNWKDS